MPPLLVSVVIPAHNRAHTLGYCLASVLGQSYGNIEVIVVDDGSSDQTGTVVRAIGDERLRLISHERPLGAQAARNTGIKAARGAWIAFHDSDDEWLPERLQRQLAVLEQRGFDPHVAVHADMIRYTPETGAREDWPLPEVAGPDAYATVLRAPGPVFQTLLVSRQALLEIGLLDENVPAFQEWESAIRLARVCEFVHLHEPLAVYWLHQGETISKNGRREIDGLKYVLGKHREEIIRVAGQQAWLRHLATLARRSLQLGFAGEAEAALDEIPWSSAIKWRTWAYFFCAKRGIGVKL